MIDRRTAAATADRPDSAVPASRPASTRLVAERRKYAGERRATAAYGRLGRGYGHRRVAPDPRRREPIPTNLSPVTLPVRSARCEADRASSRCSCSAALLASAPRRLGARHPERRPDSGVPPAGRASVCGCSSGRPLASTVNDIEWPTTRPLLDLATCRARRCAQAAAVDCRPRRDLSRTTVSSDAAASPAARVSLPSDTSFDSYETALAHVDRRRRSPRDRASRRAQAMRRRAARVSDRHADRSRFLDLTRVRDCSGCASVTVLRFVDRPTAGSSAPSSSTAIRVWSASIRAGSRPRSRFVRRWLPPHPGRHRSSAVPVCLVIPFRRFGALVVDRHVVHRRALDHADRLGLRHGAVGACGFRRSSRR